MFELKYISEIGVAIAEAKSRIDQILSPFNDIKCGIDKFVQSSQAIQMNLSNALEGAMSKVAKDALEFHLRLEEGFKRQSDDTKRLLMIWGNNGWYFDLDLPAALPREFLKDYDGNWAQEIDDAIINMYKESISVKIGRLKSGYPHWCDLLDEIELAISQKMYYSSIPLCFLTVDGIVYDKLGFSPYAKQNGILRTAQWVLQQPEDHYRRALLRPYEFETPLTYSASQRDANFKHLNRHMVMHGEDCRYGTEVNAFKAMSLLVYIGQTLSL